MTWLLPSMLAIGGTAAAITIALHFIARSRPVAEPLPTTRFIPQQPVQARARSVALSDMLLLLMRVLAIVALTAGAAGPVLSSRGRVLRVVAVDRSRGLANVSEARDSARAYLRTGDLLVVFDSAAEHSASTLDSVVATSARGSLSTGIASAIRLAARDAARADSIDVVVVSPFTQEEIDEATFKIRDSWSGRIRTVRVAARPAGARAARVEVVAATNDAVAAGLSLMRANSEGPATVRLVRTTPSVMDSAWARGAGHALVIWPDAGGAGWAANSPVDTIGGVASATGAVVATFPRPWRLDGPAVARWSDGTPAAIEHAFGAGCIRDVGILVDGASDLTLHAPFRAFVSSLMAPCSGLVDDRPMSAAQMSLLAGAKSLASAASLRDPATAVSRATPWLFALGALLLIVELAVRRGTRKLA
ncbi:MAG: BatA domain-containing protein [Gemmatimonadaceae bacterium]